MPLVVAQFGGGQIDGLPLVAKPGVRALVWADYPSQDGGRAFVDLIRKARARLDNSQYY